MMIVALSGTLIGAVFGLRLSVIALLGAIVAGMLGLGAISLLQEVSTATIIWRLIAWVVTLQVGYLGGLLVQYTMAVTRMRPSPEEIVRSRSMPPPSSTVAQR